MLGKTRGRGIALPTSRTLDPAGSSWSRDRIRSWLPYLSGLALYFSIARASIRNSFGECYEIVPLGEEAFCLVVFLFDQQRLESILRSHIERG